MAIFTPFDDLQALTLAALFLVPTRPSRFPFSSFRFCLRAVLARFLVKRKLGFWLLVWIGVRGDFEPNQPIFYVLYRIIHMFDIDFLWLFFILLLGFKKKLIMNCGPAISISLSFDLGSRIGNFGNESALL